MSDIKRTAEQKIDLIVNILDKFSDCVCPLCRGQIGFDDKCNKCGKQWNSSERSWIIKEICRKGLYKKREERRK